MHPPPYARSPKGTLPGLTRKRQGKSQRKSNSQPNHCIENRHSNVIIYFSQHQCRAVPFSSTLKRGGKKRQQKNCCTLRLKNINGKEVFSTTNLELLCREAASLFRAWIFPSTIIWKHQFFCAQPSLWSNCHIRAWLLKNHSFDCIDLCQHSDVSAY